MSPSHAPEDPGWNPDLDLIVVGIAASAGGLRALSELLGGLSPDFGAAIVIVQHLAPHHPSLLAEILGRRSELRVRSARQGDRLKPGTAFIAKPDHHLLVDSQGRLILTQTEAVRHLRPCADLLFVSIAENFGPRGIAVVLTGTGADGSEGARAIQAAEGRVIAQDRESSEFFGMPEAAIATGCVNSVLPLSSISSALVEAVQEVRSG